MKRLLSICALAALLNGATPPPDAGEVAVDGGGTASGGAPPEATAPLPTLDDEEYAILAVTFDYVFGESGSRTLVISATKGIKEGHDDAYSAEYAIPDLESKTLETFRSRNEQGGHLEKRFDRPVYLITNQEYASYWSDNDCEAGWTRYYKAHPNGSGIISWSRVGVSHDHTQALVYVGVQGACLAGSGDLYELERVKGRWKVVQVINLWMS